MKYFFETTAFLRLHSYFLIIIAVANFLVSCETTKPADLTKKAWIEFDTSTINHFNAQVMGEFKNIAESNNKIDINTSKDMLMINVKLDTIFKPILIAPGDSIFITGDQILGSGFYKNRMFWQMNSFSRKALKLLDNKLKNPHNYLLTADSLNAQFNLKFDERLVDTSLNKMLLFGNLIFNLKTNYLFLTEWKSDSLEALFYSDYLQFTKILSTINDCFLWYPEVIETINHATILKQKHDTLSSTVKAQLLISETNNLIVNRRKRDILLFQTILLCSNIDDGFTINNISIDPPFFDTKMYYTCEELILSNQTNDKSPN